MERREKETGLLQGKAERCLKQPISLLPTLQRTNYQSVLRLWHSPSFQAQKSWCLYKPTGMNSTRYKSAVVETCWDSPSDSKRMTNPLEGLKSGFLPEPTLTMRFTSFDLSKFSTLFNQPNSALLTLLPKHDSVVCDGEVWGFENFDYFQGLKMQWWGNGPKDWQPLIKTYHELLDVIQDALKTKDYQPYQSELRVEPLNEFIPS